CVTSSSALSDRRWKVAVQVAAALIVTSADEAAPLHASLQPPKNESAAGCSPRVTTLSTAKSLAQLAPQSMPAGALVIEPSSLPTVRVTGAGAGGTRFTAAICAPM